MKIRELISHLQTIAEKHESLGGGDMDVMIWGEESAHGCAEYVKDVRVSDDRVICINADRELDRFYREVAKYPAESDPSRLISR